MKAQDIIAQAVHLQMPDRELIREYCKRQTVHEVQKRSKMFLRPAIAFAIITVIVLCSIFGSTLILPEIDNVFVLKAYAMEIQSDGSIEMREIDVLNQEQMWGGYTDGENLYLNIRLSYEGENVESVKLTTEDGFFATQHFKTENGKITADNVPVFYVGENQDIVMYGTDFNNVGNSFTLNQNTMTDNLLLFMGTDYTEGKVTLKMTVQATATFNDGTTQDETITLDFTRPGVIMTGELTDDVRWGEGDLGDAPYDPSVPFEQIPDSEKPSERIHPITGEIITSSEENP